jgi:hypothetical protein
MTIFPDNKSGFLVAGILAVVALFLTLVSFSILILEYTVGNFGDSDLPPYQPDTPFEKHCDAVWYAVTGGAGLLWLCVIAYVTVYVIVLLFRFFRRRVA